MIQACCVVYNSDVMSFTHMSLEWYVDVMLLGSDCIGMCTLWLSLFVVPHL